MTSLVGINCKDGVVIGADSAVTFPAGNMHLMEQSMDKIVVIGGKAILAGTGAVGHGQRFENIAKHLWKEREYRTGAVDKFEVTRRLAQEAINNFASTGSPQNQYGALFAFYTENKSHLCEFAVRDFQPEIKELDKLWYCTMGSGQVLTDPFLAFIKNVFWDGKSPTVDEAVFAVTWTLDHAIELNAGGVNGPVRIAVLRDRSKSNRTEVESVTDDELQEHRQYIEEIKKSLSNFRSSYTVSKIEGAKEVPSPKK